MSNSTAQESSSGGQMSELSQQRVCIVGADEYVGQLLVKEYLSRKAAVTAFLPEKSEWTTQIELADMGATVVPGSLDTLQQHVQNVNTIVCTLGVRYSAIIADQDIKWDDHRVALQRVFDIATNANIHRLIVIATMEGPSTQTWLQLSKAKEAAISEMKKRMNLNKVNFTVVRPGLLFRDVTSILPGLGNCIVGKIYTGRRRRAVQNNPIHEADLAYFVAECTNNKRYYNCEVDVGGPDVINTQELYCKMLAARDPNVNLISMLQQSRYRAPKQLDRWLRYIFNQDMLGMRYGYRSLNDTLRSMQIRELINKVSPSKKLDDVVLYTQQQNNQNVDGKNPFLTQQNQNENQQQENQGSVEQKQKEGEGEQNFSESKEYEKQNVNVNIYGSGSVLIVENCDFYTPSSTGNTRDIFDQKQQQKQTQEDQNLDADFSNEQNGSKEFEKGSQELQDKNEEHEFSFRQSLVVPEVEQNDKNVESNQELDSGQEIKQQIQQNRDVQDAKDVQHVEDATSASFQDIDLDSGRDQNIVLSIQNQQIGIQGIERKNINVINAENVEKYFGTMVPEEATSSQIKNQIQNQEFENIDVSKDQKNQNQTNFDEAECTTCLQRVRTDDIPEQDIVTINSSGQNLALQNVQNAQNAVNNEEHDNVDLNTPQTNQQFSLQISQQEQYQSARQILDTFIRQTEGTEDIVHEKITKDKYALISSQEAAEEAVQSREEAAEEAVQSSGEAAGEAAQQQFESVRGTDSSTKSSTINFDEMQFEISKQAIPENICKFYRSKSDTRRSPKRSAKKLAEIQAQPSYANIPQNMRKLYRSQSDIRHGTVFMDESMPNQSIFSISSFGKKSAQNLQESSVGGLTQFKKCLQEGHSANELFYNIRQLDQQQNQQSESRQEQEQGQGQGQLQQSGSRQGLDLEQYTTLTATPTPTFQTHKGLTEYWQKRIEMEQNEEGGNFPHQEQNEE